MATVKIDKFRRFGFTTTAYITGFFDYFNMGDRSLVKDSNFNFNTDKFTISDFDDMFNGCVNATFSHTLVISSDNDANSANSMFKDCSRAMLPYAYIGDSNLTECESMFEGCSNAKLRGVDIPKNAKNVKRMFKGCKNSSFESISSLHRSTTDFTETFYGCTNGTFGNLRMPSSASTDQYVFSYMFYGCENLDSDNLNFEDISEYAYNADFMFYGAGNSGSETMDNSLLKFGKLMSCTSMFDSSRFSFVDTYAQFFTNGNTDRGYLVKNGISSIKRMFYNTSGISGKAPTIVLGADSTNSISSLNQALSSSFNGNYVVDSYFNITNGITDFTEAYAYSNMKSADLRGISNNCSLYGIFERKSVGVQDFTSMFEGCENLESIDGYIPSYGHTYTNMFYGCSSLSADISKLFMEQYMENNVIKFRMDSEYGEEFDSYNASSIAGMFYGCGRIYSSSDSFDLVGLSKSMASVANAIGTVDLLKENMKNVFSKLTLASKNYILGLEMVDYTIDDISKKYGIMRYNSFEDDPYDLGTGSSSEYGINSKYARYLFGGGFYRFGGFFKDDPNKFFCVIEKPVVDETNGDVIGFSIQSLDYSPNISPFGFSDKYNTSKATGYWNSFSYDKIYAAKIYDANSGEFIKNSFVGSYTRTLHSNKNIDGVVTAITNEYDMPVTMFNVSEDIATIEDL